MSPTYHHRRSTGAPILSAGASARSPVGSARAGSTAARVWVVDRRDSVWRRCSPGSREADVSRPAGRRNSDGGVKTPPCGVCTERVAHVRHHVEDSGGQRRRRCRACTGASILSPMGCASRRARSSRRAGSLRDALSEKRVSADQALGLDGRGETPGAVDSVKSPLTVVSRPPLPRASPAEVRARGRPEPERARPRSCSTW